MKYNWSNAQPDTRWIATDSNGWLCEYATKPHRSNWQWLVDDLNDITQIHTSSEYQGDWKDSLEEREDD